MDLIVVEGSKGRNLLSRDRNAKEKTVVERREKEEPAL